MTRYELVERRKAMEQYWAWDADDPIEFKAVGDPFVVK
jgi:hypothetical protein